MPPPVQGTPKKPSLNRVKLYRQLQCTLYDAAEVKGKLAGYKNTCNSGFSPESMWKLVSEG